MVGKKALKYLAKQEDMIITSGDKVDSIVIMDTKNNIKGANRQLSNKNNYIILQIDPPLQKI